MSVLQTIKKRITRVNPVAASLVNDQPGITAVETIILLIAFIIVASGFAFPGLITGLRGGAGEAARGRSASTPPRVRLLWCCRVE